MGVNNKMSDNNPEMRATAARICRDYLTGVWKHVSADNIKLNHIRGGLSNWVYNVQLPEGTTPLLGEPRQVLLRIYGQVHGEGAVESIITESVIFALLSERRLGPKLHGIFPGGRIEEYIPARPLLTKELADPELSALSAEKMAQIHMMQVPLSKEPTWLWETVAKWCESAENLLKNLDSHTVSQQKDNLQIIEPLRLHSEYSWLKNYVSQRAFPVVFCHNDMQEGNILLRQNPRKRELVLIDFEYCSYNYRGFDLANHFIEWQYDYTNEEEPYYLERSDAGPTDEQKIHFIRSYLKTMNREGDIAEEERLLEEIKVFSLASHLLWGLWSIVNAGHSQITFGYWDYAASRLKKYQYLKEKLLTDSNSSQCDIERKKNYTD